MVGSVSNSTSGAQMDSQEKKLFDRIVASSKASTKEIAMKLISKTNSDGVTFNEDDFFQISERNRHLSGEETNSKVVMLFPSAWLGPQS